MFTRVQVLTSEFTQKYAENISKYFWETLGNILGIVPRKFPGIDSKKLFSGNSQEFTQIWSKFSQVIFQRNSLELVTRNSLEWVSWNIHQNWFREIPRNGIQEIPRNGLREIPRNFCRHFHRILLWKIPGNFRGLLEKIPRSFRGFSAKLLLGIYQ